MKRLIDRIGKKRYEGSSVKPGVTYQEIPGLDVPSHRSNIALRADKIAQSVDLNGKSVLDLGCNVGVLSNMLIERGADSVTAVDHDSDSIALGKSLYTEVDYKNKKIDRDFVRRLKDYDVCVWFPSHDLA